MILDSITLENFGAYGGRQEAILTPKEGKPIILFGGMNGGGKTTLLDAIQLAFYGPKARLSNRNRLGYRDYLRDCIHRQSDSGEGACITLRFRRMMEGEARQFELQRAWREGVKGIEETVRVWRDGKLDDVFTEHWDEAIEAYLPSGIAHLFFFDGEQVKDLAEGGHAAEILGTAVHSLLGLDLVDRLETDLKSFERRKKAEGLGPEATHKLNQIRSELEHIDAAQEQAAMQEGALVNEAGRLAKELRAKEDQFRAEGGEIFLLRKDIDEVLTKLKAEKNTLETQFRELVAGPLPLLLVERLLAEAEQQSRHENEVRRARVLLDVLETRDNELVSTLQHQGLPSPTLEQIEQILLGDRTSRIGLAKEGLTLDADEGLALELSHLRSTILPTAEEQSRMFVSQLASLEEKIARLEMEIERVPSEDRIAIIQDELNKSRSAHELKMVELEALRVSIQALKKQRVVTEAKLDKLSEQDMDTRFAEDDRLRMLKHSSKVRDTLGLFRTRVVGKHTSRMETLMLESFQKLLRKGDLVTGLTINPETFEPTLTGKDGKMLPIERLSAGERQLLATSMLWGLARASGRPIPTIIDTPLGRLDSSHRKHLVERYFPNASHQVLLLSTDEEIVGKYHESLKPYIARNYLLAHDEQAGQTKIELGYFDK
jgi:DNA sulfur modification protein DndD